MSLAHASVLVTWSNLLFPLMFLVQYQVTTRGAWRRSIIGWHVMVLTAVDMLIFGELGAALIWPRLGLLVWYQWMYVATVWGITLVTVWRMVMQWRSQRRGTELLAHPQARTSPD